MTGPWQVLGSTRIPLDEMVKLDYLYVATWSLWGDIKILLRTGGVTSSPARASDRLLAVGVVVAAHALGER